MPLVTYHSSVMHLVYSFLLALGFLVLLPKFLVDALRHGKYRSGLTQRLGFLPRLERRDRFVVWVHCVSVGEAQAARPLIQAISKEFPRHLIVVSTVTVTGQTLARDIFKDQAHQIFYFPFDWRWTVRRALKAIQPSVVLIMETELWPGFLRECRTQAIPLAIVNGRLSEKSFRRYRLIKGFVSQVVDCLSLAVMQTDADAGRIRALGLDQERVVVSGSMKFDAEANYERSDLAREITTRFGFENCEVILAASTHDPEEQIILEAFNQLKTKPEWLNTRLIIAPRHPERFAQVAALLKNSGLRWARRSDQEAAEDRLSDVVLLDSIGELRTLFPRAAIVFVGGSIAPKGGHNILEPAAIGTCIVTGAHTQNFGEIVHTFRAAEAIVQLEQFPESAMPGVLVAVFENLLRDSNRRQELGARAKALVESNRGATKRTMQSLNLFLMGPLQPEQSPTVLTTEEGLHST